MNVQAQHQLASNKRLAKKPGRRFASDGVAFVVTVRSTFKGKSVVVSHSRLRDRTLQQHQGKPYTSSRARPYGATHPKHSVELTDDVLVVDRHGHRVPPPSYATSRIDQLPQFKKG